MKILLLSEGKHELGSNHPRSKIAAPLENIVRQLLGLPIPQAPTDDGSAPSVDLDDAVAFEHERLNASTFRGAPVMTIKGKGFAFEKKLLTWLLIASRFHIDAIVAVIDEDGDSKRIHAFDAAQESSLFCVPRAFGIAIRTFDAWMLADETALSAVLACQIPTQTSPEAMRDPKSVCQKLRDVSESQLSQTDMYQQIAARVRIDSLESRCPQGFKPFADRVRRLRSLS
jgi:hypothetical protein